MNYLIKEEYMILKIEKIFEKQRGEVRKNRYL